MVQTYGLKPPLETKRGVGDGAMNERRYIASSSSGEAGAGANEAYNG